MELYLPLSKQELKDDGTLEIWGIASSETLDSQGEIVKADAIKESLPEFFKYGTGTLRTMHNGQVDAVGIVPELTVGDDGVTTAHAIVVDPVAIKKCQTGTYKGFSIGGKKLAQTDNVVTKISLRELSLVDRPANPDSVFTLMKADVPETEDVEKKEFSSKTRKKDAKSGVAEKDGSFPIANATDLENAIKDFGRAGSKESDRKHIIERAKALGLTDKLPADWEGSTKKAKADMDIDLKKFMGQEVWDAATAMDALQSIIWLFQGESQEAQEGDPDDVQQAADLAEVITRLKSFISSEVKENDPTDETAKADVLVEEAVIPIEEIPVEEIIKAEATEELAKVGASISQANKDKAQAIHDHSVALGADCAKCGKIEKSETEVSDDLAKADDLHKADLAKIEELLTENKTLSDKLTKLEAEPAPAIGVTKTFNVSKAEDSGVEQKLSKIDDPQATAKDVLGEILNTRGVFIRR